MALVTFPGVFVELVRFCDATSHGWSCSQWVHVKLAPHTRSSCSGSKCTDKPLMSERVFHWENHWPTCFSEKRKKHFRYSLQGTLVDKVSRHSSAAGKQKLRDGRLRALSNLVMCWFTVWLALILQHRSALVWILSRLTINFSAL